MKAQRFIPGDQPVGLGIDGEEDSACDLALLRGDSGQASHDRPSYSFVVERRIHAQPGCREATPHDLFATVDGARLADTSTQRAEAGRHSALPQECMHRVVAVGPDDLPGVVDGERLSPPC